jgi:hypothetical protein
MGVPRDRVRQERRELGAGEVTLRGNTVLWLKKAAERVMTRLGLKPPTPALAVEPEKSGPAVPEDDSELLTVTSGPTGPDGRHFPNPNIIKARRPNGETVAVRVLKPERFLPKLAGNHEPMTFQARRAQSGNWWLLTGREPRFPGRW